MTIYEMHTNLKLSLDKSDSLDDIYFEQEELDYWLNRAIRSLVKTKYAGSSSARGEAFEQNQKRTDDLRTLIVETEITPSKGTSSDKPNSYQASLPSSYWFRVGEEVTIAYQPSTTAANVTNGLVAGSSYKVTGTGGITYNGTAYADGTYFTASTVTTSYISNGGFAYLCSSKRQGVTEVTADTYRFHIDDPYSEHILANNKAKPLRLFKDEEIELVTDGNYGVVAYYIRYVKEPVRVNILTNTSTAATSNVLDGITYSVSNDTITYDGTTYSVGQTFVGVYDTSVFTGSGTATMVVASCDLPDHMHDEVIVTASDMLLENTENPRVQTHIRELQRSE